MIGWTATNELRADLTAHCLRLDQSFHKERSPGEMVERIALRTICARTLAFENYFLGNYRAFLLAELRGADESAGASARWVLTKLPLDDAGVLAASAAVSEEGPG